MAPLICICTDSIAIPSHVNFTIGQTRRDHIDDCLDSQYGRQSKGASSNLKNYFEMALQKMMTTLNN